MRASKDLILASNNRNKWLEFRALLKTYARDIELFPAHKIVHNADKIQYVEKYPSYLENAIAKARMANRGTHFPVLADDSGLEVAALNGRPGIHSRRYSEERTGISQDQANVHKLLNELKNIPKDKRHAKFIAAIALVMEGVCIHATGILEGTISLEPSGTNGFGYDPVFIPNGSTKTLSELSFEEKNSISHRSLAIQQLTKTMETSGFMLAKP